MMNEFSKPIIGLIAVLACLPAWADGDGTPIVSGVIGMTPVEEGACLAVYVPMEDTHALSGILWYNNDETVVFPEVLVASGVAGSPEPVSAAYLVAESVSGASLDWSEVTFSEPIAALGAGFYVVFRLPPGSVYELEGAGGGAGIGYTVGSNGFTGWFSLNGEEWTKLQDSFGMAVQPITVEVEDDMMAKSGEDAEEVPVSHTALLCPAPNPFNPQTELRFQLREASDIALSIYNVKGEHVVRLVAGAYPAGRHSVTWRGVDSRGRKLASGIYLARFVAGDVVQTQRLLLVK